MKHGLLLLGFFICLNLSCLGQRVRLAFPTENRNLLTGDLKAFYMPTNLQTRPPESGAWGFVRNLREFPGKGQVYTRFHEGLDIRPLNRDARGIPTDPVGAIATGRVVYVNPSSGRSNYGKYVVVEHDWGSGPFFSLYAHLASTSVSIGQRVNEGDALGILGSTGRGLNNARAHVHLELTIQYSARFNDWSKLHLGGANAHGNYNGINLSGLNLGQLYLELNKNPNLSLATFLHGQPQHYRVVVPRKGSGTLPIVNRYRWMRFGDHKRPSESWEIAFTRSGFPVGVAPSNRTVSEPTVTYVRPARIDHKHYTIGRLTGTGSTASLTASGKRFIALFTDDFPGGEE